MTVKMVAVGPAETVLSANNDYNDNGNGNDNDNKQ